MLTAGVGKGEVQSNYSPSKETVMYDYGKIGVPEMCLIPCLKEEDDCVSKTDLVDSVDHQPHYFML